MTEHTAQGSGGKALDDAISHIVQMKPQKVTVTLRLPSAPGVNSQVTLEWSREDSNMPLSELLARVEEYFSKYASR